MTGADLPFVAALYASTRADEIAGFGWPPAPVRAPSSISSTAPSSIITAPSIPAPTG